MSDFIPGEIVLVKDDVAGNSDINCVYVQRFVVKWRGIYFCERDDAQATQLIGWRECRKNDINYPFSERSISVDDFER